MLREGTDGGVPLHDWGGLESGHVIPGGLIGFGGARVVVGGSGQRRQQGLLFATGGGHRTSCWGTYRGGSGSRGLALARGSSRGDASGGTGLALLADCWEDREMGVT